MAATRPELRISPDLAFPVDVVTETLLIIAKRGSGKALALDASLPTPGGWTTMGDVAVGDEVLDETGRPCTVTFATDVMEDHACYRVVFDDGSEIVADAEHLWLSETLASRRADGQARFYTDRKRGFGGRPQCERSAWPELVTTEGIRKTLHVKIGSAGRRDRNHSIRNAAPLALADRPLPVDPYVLGVWLGDGSRDSSAFTCGIGDEQIVEEIRRSGREVNEQPCRRAAGKAPSYNIVGLRPQLRQLSVLRNKHVPAEYLRASAAQRLALLQGLMDSDGTAAKSNSCTFGNTNERLADAVAELVVSLGWVARRLKRPAKLYGIEHGICHEVRFRPDRSVFRLARKAARFNPAATQQSRHQRRMIVAVEPVPSVPVRCIAVNSPSHLYLAGPSMIPTHNTHTASVLVEEMVRAGLPVCVIDPIGVWWGMRSSADGTGPGLPVTILGGEHADLPLPSESGARVADLLIDERIPVVIDLSGLSKTQQRRFVCDFMERLYHRNRDPLHLVVDEADLFAPLRGSKESARLLGAYEDIVRRGRARGLGCTSITQRPAVLHTDIRSQAEVLIALRLIGTHDVAAIDEWVRLHATDEEAREVKASLPSLPVGTAWVWSPGWLEILARVKIRQRLTFDSSATPKVGQQRIIPRAFAPVDPADLERLGARLQAAATPTAAQKAVARAPAAETVKLHAEIRTLRSRLAAAESREPEREEVPVVAPGDIAALEQIITAMRDTAGSLEIALSRAARPAPVPAPRPALAPARPAPVAREAPAEVPGDITLSKAQRAILTVLAQFPDGRSKRQLGMLTGYSTRGGGFNNALGALRTAGLIGRGEPISATDAGLAALGSWEPLPEGPALIGHWLGQLSKAEGLVLRAVLDAWPASLTKDEIAAATGYAASGGGFNNALGRLRTLQLIEGSRDIRADETLAQAALETAGGE